MAKILVTGGDGFTGHYLCKRLSDLGYEVIALARTSDAGYVGLELTDKAAVKSLVAKECPDYVIHLAGISFAAHKNSSEIYSVNTVGTENLLSALASSAPRVAKVILASSSNVYGVPKKQPVSETDSTSPINHYACSKLAMEHIAATFYSELPIVITRPFNYTGSGQASNFLIPKIVQHFAEKLPTIQLGNTNIARDFSSIDDVVEYYVRLLESDCHSTTVNLCSGAAISLKEILSNLICISGHELDVEINPEFVRKNDIPTIVGDRSKLEALVKVGQPMCFKNTLEEMFRRATA